MKNGPQRQATKSNIIDPIPRNYKIDLIWFHYNANLHTTRLQVLTHADRAAASAHSAQAPLVAARASTWLGEDSHCSETKSNQFYNCAGSDLLCLILLPDVAAQSKCEFFRAFQQCPAFWKP